VTSTKGIIFPKVGYPHDVKTFLLKALQGVL